MINYFQTDDPIKEDIDIARIIAMDPQIARVGRLINLTHKVNNCYMKLNEELGVYFARFR